MICADGIQEYIETMRDLKANNAEQSYLDGLKKKIRGVESGAISAELVTAVIVTSAGMILKLSIATVTLVGSIRLVSGRIDVLTLFMFLLVASRLYDPMQASLQNLAAVIAMRTNVARMNEILDHPVQSGKAALTNNGCDIVFDHVGFAYNDGETVLRDVSRRLSARPAAAKRPCRAWRQGSGITKRAKSLSAVWIFPRSTPRR